jgi:hypothetical protein
MKGMNVLNMGTSYTILGTSGVVSHYRTDDRGSIPGRGKGFFLEPLCPDRFCGPPSLLSNGYQVSLPWGKSRLGCDVDHSLPSSAEVKNK